MRLGNGWRAAILFAATLVAVGCKGPADPSQNVTETLTGTVSPKSFGLSTSFNVPRRGEYSITLLGLNPPASVFLTVQLGLITNGLCVQFGAPNTQAGRGQVVLGGSIEPGTYCVYVFDQNVLTTDTAFTLSAFHP